MGYKWTQIDEAEDLYFSFGGNIYKFDANNNQLVYQNKGDPERILRTALPQNDENNLVLYYSDRDKVKVYDMNYIPSAANTVTGWTLSINTNNDSLKTASLTVGLGNKRDAKSYYICDKQGRVLLGFNNPMYFTNPASLAPESVTIYLNQMKIRNI